VPERPSETDRAKFVRGAEGTAVKELQVDVDNDDTIIVSKPGTEFLVAYQMRPNEPFLIMTHSWLAPTIMSREITDFRAKAFAAATAKARELGWIV
jgi:hypothetical protein